MSAFGRKADMRRGVALTALVADDPKRSSSRLCETRTDWNAERSEGTQTFPQAASRKIQEDTQLRGECATCGVKQMNGKRLNLKVCQDDPQRTVIYRVGTLVVQNASHTQALGCSPNSRLGGGH